MAMMKLMTTLLLALLAFAANSVYCRIALKGEYIDPASFTVIRLFSGAIILWLICFIQKKRCISAGSWLAAFCLFIYASCFSFAYMNLFTGTGALLLFAAVQITMMSYSFYQGERFSKQQYLGFVCAIIGVVLLIQPSTQAVSLLSALLMFISGIAWAIYTLLGKKNSQPLLSTTGNFILALPFCLLLIPYFTNTATIAAVSNQGIVYAIISGAIASGLGYAIWYSALPFISANLAATLQLSVPMLAAFAGIVWLDEPLTLVLLVASLIILGGIFLVLRGYKKAPA